MFSAGHTDAIRSYTLLAIDIAFAEITHTISGQRGITPAMPLLLHFAVACHCYAAISVYTC